MTITADGRLELDEIKMYYDLAAQSSPDLDLVMLVDNAGTAVEGESTRAFADGKPRMDIGGYYWSAQWQNVNNTERGRISMLTVVRRSDAATATLANLLKSRDMRLRVLISAFKAGGELRSVDMVPTFEIELEQARIQALISNTGGVWQVPSELIVFAHRGMTIRSAPQQHTGLAGAQRECRFTFD